METKQPANYNKTLQKLYRQRYLLLMLAPTIILISVFAYKPLTGWVMAFKDYRPGKNLWETNWVGLSYLIEFFQDTSDSWRVIKNTLVMNFTSLMNNMLCAMIFAILLNELSSFKFKRFVQTVSLFPFFISWMITYSIVYVFFSVNAGVVNTFLVSAGILKDGINILGDPKYSWGLMIGLNLWKSLGYNSIIFLAAIAGIDQELYEAATIDGASWFQKALYITVPCISPTFAVLIILNSGWLLESNFEQFYIFTNPTNITTMEVFEMYIYRFGLGMGRYAYATAVCIVKTAVSLILLTSVNYLSKRLTDKSVF